MESAEILKSLNFSIYFNRDSSAEKISNFYLEKEKDWIKLVGKERWFSLSEEKREFLIMTAGAFDIGDNLDIESTFDYYE